TRQDFGLCFRKRSTEREGVYRCALAGGALSFHGELHRRAAQRSFRLFVDRACVLHPCGGTRQSEEAGFPRQRMPPALETSHVPCAIDRERGARGSGCRTGRGGGCLISSGNSHSVDRRRGRVRRIVISSS